MRVSGNSLRVGMLIEHKNSLWRVVKTQHTQPGKGGAYLQAELKNLYDHTKLNERFRSSENVERVSLDPQKHIYLYQDQSNFVFMNTSSFEQVSISGSILDDQARLLSENLEVIINFYGENPVAVEFPKTIECTVLETEAVIKGQTASASYKPAVLTNGLTISVPPHIQPEMKIIVNTEDLTYSGKVK